MRFLLNFFKRLLGLNKQSKKIYTIEEYLDIVSIYTDEVIEKEETNKNFFTGGDCKVSLQDKMVNICIRMYFIDNENERTLKESERNLKLDNFDMNTQEILKKGECVYEINKPRKETV